MGILARIGICWLQLSGCGVVCRRRIHWIWRRDVMPDIEHTGLGERDLVTHEYHLRVVKALVAERDKARAEVERRRAATSQAAEQGAVERLAESLAREDGNLDDFATNAGQVRDYHMERARQHLSALGGG